MVTTKDDVEMKKKALKRLIVSECFKKTMIELEKKYKREENKYCLKQIGQ